MKVVFVGDRPSAKNLNPDVPFIGTVSGKRLLRLLAEVPSLQYSLANAYKVDGTPAPIPVGRKYFALGFKAAQRLDKLGLPYTKLPHPSPLNRFWNQPDADQQFVQMVLRGFWQAQKLQRKR